MLVWGMGCSACLLTALQQLDCGATTARPLRADCLITLLRLLDYMAVAARLQCCRALIMALTVLA